MQCQVIATREGYVLTYKDLMKFSVQFAALLLFFRVLLYLPYEIYGLQAGGGFESVVPIVISLALVFLALALWSNPGVFLPRLAKGETGKVSVGLNAQMVVSAGSFILGLYFVGTGIDDLAGNIVGYLNEFLDLRWNSRISYGYGIPEITRGAFGLVLIIKAPQLGRWLDSRLDATTAKA